MKWKKNEEIKKEVDIIRNFWNFSFVFCGKYSDHERILLYGQLSGRGNDFPEEWKMLCWPSRFRNNIKYIL